MKDMTIPGDTPPGPIRGRTKLLKLLGDNPPLPVQPKFTRGADIPPHWKLYRLYILCPRQMARVLFTGKELKTPPGSWEFGKLPAASAAHALDTFWKNCPHVGPALLNAEGVPVRQRRIDKRDVKIEEIPFEEEIPPTEIHHPVVE